jgi:hypothetical protein
MKLFFTSLFTAFTVGFSVAQINITVNEMPSAGDSARLTYAVINPLLNFAATGANYNWNFANLRNNNQDIKNYQSVSSTGIIYSIFYSNLPFNPNRANVAEPGQPLPANPLLTITDPYNFYFRSNNQYKQVGFGAEIAGFQTPVAFSQHDVIYQLPLQYNDIDTSHSAWNLALPGLGYYGFNQTRINTVDGWGTLTTPHNTYNVLRVKTELLARDTISVDTLSLNFALDRPKTTQYKWLANNEIVPVMQITTTEVLGVEVITEIFYRDDYNTVQPNNLNVAYCAGSTITIPYTATGSFNGAGLFLPANVFTAQLSDSTGSFANAVNIGSMTSRVSGNITATIPANTPAGNGYRIRIIASSPSVTGGDNGFDIRIEQAAISSITAGGVTSFCQGDSVVLQSVFNDVNYQYQWLNSGNAITGATANSFSATLSGNYTLDITNSCGTATSNPITIVVSPLPSALVTASGSLSFCSGDSVTLSAPIDPTFSYQWQLNGTDIAGATTADLVVLSQGNYTVILSNSCGSDTSSAQTITVQTWPNASTITSIATSFCAGDSIALTYTAVSGNTLSWLYNGTLLSGISGSTYYATQPGSYTVVETNSCGSDTSAVIGLQVDSIPVAQIAASGPLSFCTGDSVMLSGLFNLNDNWQWYFNGLPIGQASPSIVVNQDGNYYAEVTNNCGTSISNTITINLYPVPATPAIVLSNDTLLTGSNGAFYQWFYNGNPISGATGSYYVPTTNGDYTVMITDSNGCTAISTIFTMTTVSVGDYNITPFSVFPNPFNDLLIIELNQATQAELYSSDGKLLMQQKLEQGKNRLALGYLKSGMYVLRMTNDREAKNFKLIKK